MEPQHFQVTTTIDTNDNAKKLARSLVEKKLAACAQISGPIGSIYWWEGKLDSSEEWRVAFKIKASLYEEVEESIQSLHPYELPQIIATPIVAGSDEYLSWIDENSKHRV